MLATPQTQFHSHPLYWVGGRNLRDKYLNTWVYKIKTMQRYHGISDKLWLKLINEWWQTYHWPFNYFKLGGFVTSGVKGLIKQIGFHSYLQIKGGYSHLLPSPLFLPSLPTIQCSLHPPRQSEAGNSIRYITEPLEISAFSACSGARDGETDTHTYTHTRWIPQVWDNQCQQSSSR